MSKNKFKNLTIFSVVAMAFLFSAKNSEAAITFSNGKWENSYDCQEWIHDWPPTLNCAGLSAGGNDCAGSPDDIPCAGTDQCRGESILAAANNPGGVAGSRAQVHYFYTGVDGNGTINDVSGGLLIRFPQMLQEYWFRSYVYYPTEMTWGSTYSGWKTFYFDHEDGRDGWYFGLPKSSTQAGFYFQTNDTFVEVSGYGNNWLESNGRQGFGRWIPLEIHFKNDTNGTNGIVQVWVDSTLIINVSNHDFAINGFETISVGSNGTSAVSYNHQADNKAVGIRFDDLVIATPSYSGFIDDGSGHQRIGLIGASSDTTAPAAPAGLSVL